MKALIYKDLLSVWKYCRNYLLLCGAFLVLSVSSVEYTFLQLYPLILVGSLVSTLIAYDERDKWDRQVLTMPVTRKQYVAGKYLTGLILQMTVLVLTGAARGVQLGVSGSFGWMAFWADMAVMAVIAFASPALILPFVFKNGSEKGRMAYLIVMGAMFGLSAVFGAVMKKMDLLSAAAEFPVTVLAVAAAAVLYPASWALSVRWYEKREI